MKSAVLGLDPATRRLGWALADLETPAAIVCSSEDVTGLARNVREALRTIHVAADSRDYDIQLIYVEATFGGGRNARAGAMVAEAAGQVIQAASRTWSHVPIERLAPTEWKKLLGISAHAKPDVYAPAVRELGWDIPVLGVRSFHDDYDAAAAAGIASAAIIRNDDILERAGAA